MAQGMIKVTLVGNLGGDPEVRHTAGGTAVANLRVACTEKIKKGDNWEEHTEWVNVVCFGKTAENAGQYLKKGRQVYVEGRLQTKEWTDKEGNKRTSTEVISNQILFLGSGEGKPAAKTETEYPPLSDSEIPF